MFMMLSRGWGEPTEIHENYRISGKGMGLGGSLKLF